MSPVIMTSVLTAACLALPLTAAANAKEARIAPVWQVATQCRVVGAVSHRCYYFHSDATWREGLADYHGSNGP